MDKLGDARLRFATSPIKALSQAKEAVTDSAKRAVKKSPKTFMSFINLLHIPYLPLIAHHGKVGWLVNYIRGPYKAVSYCVLTLSVRNFTTDAQIFNGAYQPP